MVTNEKLLTEKPNEVVEQLLEIVSEEGMVPREAIKMDAELEVLGIKSADFVMILMAIEEKFGVYLAVDEELTSSKTVGGLLEIVIRRIDEHRATQQE